MAEKHLYSPQLHEKNVRRLYAQARRFNVKMTVLLNLLVSTSLEQLEEVETLSEWQTVVPQEES